jgi:hypothetical protein
VCATCHELTWPGAGAPLYDTWSQWAGSAYAEAGVGCTDCHAIHGQAEDPGRAVSVLLDVDRTTATRGGEPIHARVTLQNTGAGHPFPAGSPYRGVQLRIALVPPTDDSAPIGVQDVVLARTLQDGPPWATVADTRLGIGEARSVEWTGALPQDAAAGAWFLQITLTELFDGVPTAGPFVERRLPLTIH